MIGPKKFMKGHHKTFAEQTTWRPIPAIGQNYPHPPFRLGSTRYPTEPIPSILLTELARGGTQVDKIRGYATRSVSSFGDGYWNMGADALVGRKKNENLKIRKFSSTADAADIDLRIWKPMRGHRLKRNNCYDQRVNGALMEELLNGAV